MDDLQQQYQNYAGVTGRLGGAGLGSLSGMANAIQPTQQDTVNSLLDQISNLVAELHGRVGFVADSLEGSSPKATTGGNAQAGRPSTIEHLRGIAYALEAASAEANRAARALGVR